MKLQSCSRGQDLYLYLSGELDECSVREMRILADRLIDEHAGLSRAVFNLAGVKFMDSTAIGFLIGRYKKLKQYNMQMLLESPDQSADKILSMSGVYSLIPRV